MSPEPEGTTWPTEAEREELAEALFRWNTPHAPYFIIGGGHLRDDADADNPYRPIANAALIALIAVVARREREAAARALRDAEREAHERGDIGKNDGPEAWAWLAHLADRVERGEP